MRVIVSAMAAIHPLKLWILERGETQEAFAHRAGVAPQNLSDILRWRRDPTLPTIRKLIRATGGALDANAFMR